MLVLSFLAFFFTIMWCCILQNRKGKSIVISGRCFVFNSKHNFMLSLDSKRINLPLSFNLSPAANSSSLSEWSEASENKLLL